MLLWHGREPIGICVFGSPAASLTLRSRYFGLTNPRAREALTALNRQLWLLSRVVLHPTYRGAGIAAAFVRQACRTCPAPWIETLSVMARVNPFFERAGFVRVGQIDTPAWKRLPNLYGRCPSGRDGVASARRALQPVYLVFDNRK